MTELAAQESAKNINVFVSTFISIIGISLYAS